MVVRDVLREPLLAAAEPCVVAGAGPGSSALDRPVTWVHTSEVLHVAALLRGGEFLLVGGVVLGAVDPERRRRYVRELAERSVTALAVECGDGLPEMPPEMCEIADEVGLPLVELRRIVRFVEVCQSVNGQLAHESVRRLQVGDRISRALVDALSGGADLPELLAVLANQVASDVELRGLDGDTIASASAPAERDGPGAGSGGWSAPVVVTGLTMAVVTIAPRRSGDTTELVVALEKAPEVLAIALLRSRPPSARDHAVHDFIGLALEDEDAGAGRLVEVGSRLGLDPQQRCVAVVADLARAASAGDVESVLGRRGRTVVAQVREGRFLGVVTVDAPAERGTLIADLESATLPDATQVVVGSLAKRLADVPRSLRGAVTVQGMECRRSGPPVVDSGDYAVESLLLSLDDAAVAAFVEDQLGDLADEHRHDRGLVATLSTFVRHWGRKVDTAASLHLGRQGLYRRLDTIFAALGPVRRGTPRVGAVVVAVELETARRRLGRTSRVTRRD
ncbi:PucR family transcriptional regulator [Pseudonocardia parietis]|uniref:Purine catabolism regulator n=1 Tax=Pseudonocardia parietis TaxID=570936 RepID=A0ABS4VV00_9PSEU|nr:PucR family transcriptional regulator [Pseudonocardia parietis]MBP2367741.1 purine catabolism regulator [Pseudonocardia parietis]